jgi:predicted membrane metal-binding protein
MAAEKQSYNGLMHADGGTALFLLPLAAMIPGLLPVIGLLAVITAVIVLPLVALTLVAAVLVSPPLGLWLIAKRIRTRRLDSRALAPTSLVPDPARSRP